MKQCRNECGRRSSCRGYCRACYRRLRRAGEIAPLRERRFTSPRDVVLSRITVSKGGCWIWPIIDTRHDSGYGKLSYKCKNYRAHRFAYEAFVGPIPEGMALDHLCRVKACVNPQHLEPVTWRENTRRHHASRVAVSA